MSHPTFPTPPTAPISETVYPPSEDSYLLLDLLPLDAPFLIQRFSRPTSDTSPCSSTPLLVELGPGSGIVTSFLLRHGEYLLGRSDFLVTSVDANPDACECTRDTVALISSEESINNNDENATPSSIRKQTQSRFLGAINGDLLTSLRPHSIDILVFNPPYVPSDTIPSVLPSTPGAGEESEYDRTSRLLALTFDGGHNGMEVTWRFLEMLETVMSERGVVYLLLCAQNRPQEVVEWVKERGWGVVKVGGSGKKAGWERLGVWRVWR
ncbi:hypothetical protein EX30DRAFT_314356, partial [Ascodesmis nigricans]